jgi:peptidoglycan/LPS O-acetylase OafA/YrhL
MNARPAPSTPSRNLPLGYLRAFITVLVVVHHAFLAYHPFAPPPPRSLAGSLIWTAFPIVDTQRAPGVDLVIGFDDIYFMSLMFLLAGVFGWSSLTRRGAASYIGERARRLGIPFIFGAAILGPLAYYPTWLQTGGAAGPFWTQWLALGIWPAGPVWFLWVLLAFSIIAATLFTMLLRAGLPRAGERLGSIMERLGSRPIAWFAALVLVSAMAYVPMALAFTPESWSMAGPFFVQTSRVLHYAVYFAAGLGLGAVGTARGLLDPAGKLARRWPLWLGASITAFIFAIAMLLIILSTLKTGGPSTSLLVIGNMAFVLSCASSSLALVALFLRFARKSGRLRDSLSANAYGIYILHYVCVSWLQYALLGVNWSGWPKALTVFSGALLIAWLLSAALRKVPGLRMVLGEQGGGATTVRPSAASDLALES